MKAESSPRARGLGMVAVASLSRGSGPFLLFSALVAVALAAGWALIMAAATAEGTFREATRDFAYGDIVVRGASSDRSFDRSDALAAFPGAAEVRKIVAETDGVEAAAALMETEVWLGIEKKGFSGVPGYLRGADEGAFEVLRGARGEGPPFGKGEALLPAWLVELLDYNLRKGDRLSFSAPDSAGGRILVDAGTPRGIPCSLLFPNVFYVSSESAHGESLLGRGEASQIIARVRPGQSPVSVAASVQGRLESRGLRLRALAVGLGPLLSASRFIRALVWISIAAFAAYHFTVVSRVWAYAAALRGQSLAVSKRLGLKAADLLRQELIVYSLCFLFAAGLAAVILGLGLLALGPWLKDGAAFAAYLGDAKPRLGMDWPGAVAWTCAMWALGLLPCLGASLKSYRGFEKEAAHA